MSSVVGFIHSKGGVGKSTLTLYTAAALTEIGHDVRVFDSDPQASACRWATIAEENGMPFPFSVIPAPSAQSLRSGVEQAHHDGVSIILIDTPPGTPEVLDAAVQLVDLALVPTGASPMDIDRVWPTLQLLAQIPTAVVLNALDARESAATVAKSALEDAGITVADTVVPMRAAIRRAFGTNPTPVPAVYSELAAEIQEAVS